VRRLARSVVPLLVLALLALLGLVADSVIRGMAEDRVATLVQESQALPERPEVAIHGFPFLTQAVAGDFSDIEVTSALVDAGTGIGVESVVAHLRGVQVRLRSVLSGQVPEIRVRDAEVSGLVPYPTVARLVEGHVSGQVTDVRVEPADDALLLSGTYGGIPLQVPLQIRLGRGRLVVAVPDAALAGLPTPLRAVAESLTIYVALPDLPYGLAVSRLAPGPTGLTLGATAHDLTLEAR